MRVDQRDKSLMFFVAVLAVVFAALTFVGCASARVPLSQPAVYSIGSGSCSMFVDGCLFAGGLAGNPARDADAERSYYLTIKDGAAMGIDAFGLDIPANTPQATWQLGRLAAAMKRYNGENASARKCIFVSYRSSGGEGAAMFRAADSGGSADSPYCEIDGKPLIGIRQTNACVNPLGAAGSVSTVVIATMADAPDSVPTAACVSTWKASGASRVISYTDAAADLNLRPSAKATAATNGSEFAVGVPSAKAKQCGGPECSGPAAQNYTMQDGSGYLAALRALRASLADRTQSVVFVHAFPGEWQAGSSWEAARVCDANDTVPHNTTIGGVSTGFSCPTVPDRMRGTIPMGQAAVSYTNKAFVMAGFNRIGQWWASLFKATSDPAARPFVAFAYREHPLSLSSPPLSVAKSWVATNSSTDWSYYTPAGSEFSAGQSPWGAYDMAGGDVFSSEASSTGRYMRMRTVTGPMRVGNNLPKGNPNVTFGDHFDIRPSIRPFGDGVWSNTINELKVTVGGTATPASTGAYARAIQIHGFRTAYTGSAWQNVSTTDGDTYDIQIRYRTAGSFPAYGGGSDVFRERKKLGDHTWDIYRTDGGWASDLGMGFVLTQNVESVSNVDVKAILDYALADANQRYSRADTGIYVRGVQLWTEVISGTTDTTTEGVTVRYNGQTYGTPTGFSICPEASVSVDGGAGDNLYITSYSADPIRLRVSVGSTVMGTYTLPARQADLDTDARQLVIPFSSARGRPKLEVLDASGNVIASRDGDVAYTDNPLQRTNATGRNVSLYSDFFNVPVGGAAASASIIKVNGDRAEGDTGTSVSTFRVVLDKPAPVNSVIDWSVSSATATADDFYSFVEVPDQQVSRFVIPGPQCTNVQAPPPAAALGLTELEFCDDFSTDSVARGATEADRTMVPGKHLWNTESAPAFGAGFTQPAGDITFPGDGTMRMRLTANQYQKAIQTVQRRNGVAVGYWAGKNPKVKTKGYYIEFRMRHDVRPSNSWLAVWMMDMCHWAESPEACSARTPANRFLEMDLLEYNTGNFTWHQHSQPPQEQYHLRCNYDGPDVPFNTWFTSGSRMEPGGVNTFFRDNSQVGKLDKASCPNLPMEQNLDGQQPILIGGQSGDGFSFDFVRVWKAPGD